ncbi:MAG: 16S rRNA (cytidine(1402)-2'-O)-methyltransferase [Acidobacteria bacterium]|nr:MAG: 16S rRNA (cytidine(1402)-2'-O)-methyltransferase [Acidobacteriota bacterium]
MPGTLYMVATPIGNLEDLTFRARRILSEVDLIAAEDTRRTSHLLSHYQIKKPMVSLREHNEAREAARLVEKMLAGQSVAVVTDAGTPGIADPGARMVNAARAAGIQVVPIPGASAVTAAMSVSGSTVPEFTFLGFPPAKGEDRNRWFERLAGLTHPAVFFEAPHRIERTVAEVEGMLVKKHILVLRELTKLNETVVERPNNVSTEQIKPIGEFCVVVIPEIDSNEISTNSTAFQREALNLFTQLTAGGQVSEEFAIELIALKLAVTEAAARKAVKKAKISVKQQNQ